MPLSAATSPRRLLHTREVTLQGYLREDGLIEVEARMTDVKSYSMANIDRAGIPAGVPLHDMWIRMTLTLSLIHI